MFQNADSSPPPVPQPEKRDVTIPPKGPQTPPPQR